MAAATNQPRASPKAAADPPARPVPITNDPALKAATSTPATTALKRKKPKEGPIMDPPVPAADSEQSLRGILETFETRLATPIVSGELQAWARAVAEAWTVVAPEVRRHCDHHHRDQYARMTEEDPELLPRVEKLQTEDEAIRREIATLTAAVERLVVRAEKVEPHEGRLDVEVEALGEQGVAFINRVRKQEVAVQTWFLEAFNRDRGVAAD
jgi:hypothetical protein